MIAGLPLLLVLAALVAAGAAGRQLHRYPGGWKFAFGSAYSAARRDLDTARNALRTLERAAQWELSGAQNAVRKADSTHRRELRRAEEALAYLREPGRGGYRDEIRDLSLYEHVLVASGTDDWSGDLQLPLHEMSIRADHSAWESHVYLTGPDGRRHLLTYPHTELAEEYVRRFVLDVQNAIATDKAFQRDRPRLIREAGAELRRLRGSATGPTEEGRRLEEVTARQSGDPRIPRARQELDAAHARWQALTGRRPH
ncbi:hypothetical protein ACIBO4_13610 [Streptomyces sp. NPDC050149]|uniref:hypothetical protein n=1 Tax=Streptomyces sp. NPDC050149 TaxID=3365603 RepID=UPI0037B0E652